MIRKLVLPKCACCGLAHSLFESPEYSMILCYQCLTTLAAWAYREGVIDSNPLLQVLLDGVWARDGNPPDDAHYNAWIPSKDSVSYQQVHVKRV